jgi:hypothetical protein
LFQPSPTDDRTEFTLRLDKVCHRVPIGIRSVEVVDVVDKWPIGVHNLRPKRLGLIQDMVGPQRPGLGSRFWSRGCRQHGKAGQFRKLNLH